MERRQIVVRMGETLLGGLFAYAGIVKALDPAIFAREIDNYQLLPWPVAATLALFLPWLEIVCGIALITRRFHRGALLIINTLLLIFLGALLSAWFRDLNISCGCFGKSGNSVARALMIDLLLSVVTVGLLWNVFCSDSKPAS